jgi:hypothetical protein
MLVEAGIVFEIETGDEVEGEERAKAVLLDLFKGIEDDPIPIKVWVSGHPNNEIRIATFNSRHVRCMYDPEYGFTPDGEKFREEKMAEALEQHVEQATEAELETEDP